MGWSLVTRIAAAVYYEWQQQVSKLGIYSVKGVLDAGTRCMQYMLGKSTSAGRSLQTNGIIPEGKQIKYYHSKVQFNWLGNFSKQIEIGRARV